MIANFQYHTNVPLGVCDRHTEMVSSSTKNGGLADSETLNIPYSPCFPYNAKYLDIGTYYRNLIEFAKKTPDHEQLLRTYI